MKRLLKRGRLCPMFSAALLAMGLEMAAARAEEIVVALPGATATAANAGATAPSKRAALRIEDVQGTYTIPFIQASRSLGVRIEFSDSTVATAEVGLLRDGKALARQSATRSRPLVGFVDLSPGEYTLQCRGLDADSHERSRVNYDRIGIGVVIAALGDSITEGYLGHGFKRKDLNLSADRFPPESVSKDGRNFPQFAPTTTQYLPNVNCFESWMTALNDRLAATWRQPVFIANEGWGGITTGRYLAMMRQDAGWKKRMRRLQPQLWLIHLGVNDERAHLGAAEVRANLAGMVDELVKNYQAKPAHIFLAAPCYDYFPGAAEILAVYAREIAGLIEQRGLGRGPDFYAAYAQDKRRWYGSDPVHPNVDGMVRMAELWRRALARQLPAGP